MRRRLEFLGRVGRAILPRVLSEATGSRPAAVTLLLGLFGYVISSANVGPGSPISIGIGLGTVFLAFVEASYSEWNRWAPHRPPRLEIEAFHGPGYAGVFVTNNDIDGHLRANIIDVRGPKGSLSWGADHPWPLRLGWGDGLSDDPWVPRGERQSIKVVSFAGDDAGDQGRFYEFRGPMGVRQIPLRPDDDMEQRDIEVVIQYFRRDPEPSSMIRSERISYPR